MKVVRVVGYHQDLKLEEAEQPKVTSPLDVIVKIGAAGVCRTDLHILEGQWAEKSGVKLPYTIGHENAGWIHEIGEAASGLKVGDAVILHPLVTCGLCRACRFGDDVHCEASAFPGIDSDGGYAEYLKTTARSVIKLDPKLEPSDVAALADAGLTAYHAVAKAARVLRPGEVVVMIGAGGLGHIGIQVMKAISGATLVVIDQNPDALALAKKLGADHVIQSKEDGSFVKEVQDLTGGKGAEAVIDFVAEGGSTATGVKMLRRAGNYYIVGYGENLNIPTIDIISTEINFIGNLVGSYNDLAELMILAAQGKVVLHTSKYKLEDFQQAIDDLSAGKLIMADNEVKSKASAEQEDKTLAEQQENEEEGEEGEEDGEEEIAADGAPSKKKRKPRKKKKAASDDTAVARQDQPKASVQDIQALLQQLAVSQGNPKEGKKPEEYKFWNTQPVPKFREPNLLQTTDGGEGESLAEGPILPPTVCKKVAKPELEKLVDGFEWCGIDLEDKEELQEFYDLLYNHYVEDTEGSFRFNYSKEFLAWALKPPGWTKECHIGVRTKTGDDGKKGKLVASIAGIPVSLTVRGKQVDACEINFLAIHRKLRNKRLAPVLIKEVTRRYYLNGIYQALYTAGTLLPTPVSTCRYYHRSLDWEHLYKNGFSHLPPHSSELRMKLKYKLEDKTALKGLRPMKPADIPAVKELLSRYNERFHLRQNFTEEDVAHYLCSDISKGVVWSYVVEEKGKITDFISYYLLESTVLKSSNKRETIRAAYLYYYASDSAFPSSTSKAPSNSTQNALQARLQLLVHDALILAKKDDFHVFNALTLLDNPLFLKEQKFEPGDGKLHYYLFNWRTESLNGGVDERNQIDVTKMGGVGVVML
ncbi:uncharacterized protein MYCGRDRAFT_109408 [Zymoseptoria tritici IPO323]|uniref:Glycylpeptide N-tetradecanoyltransferase n=1 Tax=Zymoseptoria tritici (strain CBS 115943 / IPO323) TaxID=336722 RepID=F9XBB7_ZYMTI|nr:uncharacterized protein MYCGRDRAFT_109408 [Zymoseptoria tritici IPO323]EGP87678.1 hypothetical protein MYCGRDRAFT_109408 [Zymoseptoria tritici IPO323]